MTNQENNNDSFENISDGKLRWMCRRGMLELDVLLQNFVVKHYKSLDADNKKLFLELLKHEDTELWDWLVIAVEKTPKKYQYLIGLIRDVV